MWNSALISVNVCFSVLVPTMPIIFPHFVPERGKIISVVACTAENLLAFLATTQEMFGFEHLHEFETICQFTVGFQSGASADVFHEEKVK
jgi:hypothetical protein